MAMKIGTNDVKAYVGSNEVDRIYLGNSLVYEKQSNLPAVPFTLWSGSAFLNYNIPFDILPNILNQYSKTGTKLKIETFDFGDLILTNDNGLYSGVVYPTGPPQTGQYFVSLFIELVEVGNSQIKPTNLIFTEGNSYPIPNYSENGWSTWIAKIEVIEW